MHRTILFFGVLWLAAALGGCGFGPKSASGFRLPDGDAALGKQTFVELQCHVCHTVEDVELPAPQETGRVQFTLGGKTSRVKTYGHLVTSIINPSHKLSKDFVRGRINLPDESPMRNYNDVMTVQQLVDLVAFLQSTYKVVEPEYRFYAYPTE